MSDEEGRGTEVDREIDAMWHERNQLRARVAELEKENARLRARARTASGDECYQPWEE